MKAFLLKILTSPKAAYLLALKNLAETLAYAIVHLQTGDMATLGLIIWNVATLVAIPVVYIQRQRIAQALRLV